MLNSWLGRTLDISRIFLGLALLGFRQPAYIKIWSQEFQNPEIRIPNVPIPNVRYIYRTLTDWLRRLSVRFNGIVTVEKGYTVARSDTYEESDLYESVIKEVSNIIIIERRRAVNAYLAINWANYHRIPLKNRGLCCNTKRSAGQGEGFAELEQGEKAWGRARRWD